MKHLPILLELDDTIGFYANPLSVWANALAMTVAVFVVLLLLRRSIRQRAATIPYAGVKLVLEVAARTGMPSMVLLALACGTQLLSLTHSMARRVDAFIISLIVVRIGLWTATWLRLWLVRDLETSQDPKARSVVTLVQFFANFFIGAVVVVLLLETFGVQVRTLVAGLGIGGIAVALAVQNVLGDLLAAVSIALDKPFVVGDSLQLDNGMHGVVELIGVKTTRLRSVTGELIIVGNSDLQKSRLRNFGRLEKRSAVVSFEVDKLTSPSDLARIPIWVREAAASIPLATIERVHVTGITSTGISVEYFLTVNVAVYQQFLDVQQTLLLSLLSQFQQQGIRLATPAVLRARDA